MNGGTHTTLWGQGRRDLPNTALKCGVWWLDGPSLVAKIVQGSSTR